MIGFGIIGAGWRSEFYIRIASLVPEEFNITGIYIRNSEKKKEFSHKYNIKIFDFSWSNYFLYGLFTYSGLSRYISEYATGANVLGLTANILERIKCIIPPQRIANQYSQKSKMIFDQIHIVEKENVNLTKQRDLLLPRLMSGKLEV